MDEVSPCRYWESGDQEFLHLLNFGQRPTSDVDSPSCNRHYQLARTALVGDLLARESELDFSLWLIVTKTRWRSIEKNWLDFVDRIREDVLWRRMRVLAWEDVRNLGIR